MNEQNINNGMNGGPGMPPPPPQGYMNMNGGPGMPPPPPQGYMNMNGGPGMPPPPPQGYMNMNGGPGDAPAAASGLYEHECQTAAEEKSCGVSEQIQDVWYSGTGICDHMCGVSVQQLVEYIVGCAFDSINSVYQYMHGTI